MSLSRSIAKTVCRSCAVNLAPFLVTVADLATPNESVAVVEVHALPHILCLSCVTFIRLFMMLIVPFCSVFLRQVMALS